MTAEVERAAAMIAEARSIVAFTGAGVSAESGIPTYRGEGGLWKEYESAKCVDIGYFRKDPTLFWSFFRDVRYRTLVDSRPNAAHESLAELERAGRLHTVITQNIDGLHLAAGNTNVIELHGNTRVIGCLECDADHDFEDVARQVQERIPPICDKCGGPLKPRVTFFGEALPSGAMERAAEAVVQCDLLLVVGSTLQVFPAASLPLLAKRQGAAVIIINKGPTAMDEIADVVVDDRAGEILPAMIPGGAR